MSEGMIIDTGIEEGTGTEEGNTGEGTTETGTSNTPSTSTEGNTPSVQNNNSNKDGDSLTNRLLGD